MNLNTNAKIAAVMGVAYVLPMMLIVALVYAGVRLTGG
jgi:hypothetical protein